MRPSAPHASRVEPRLGWDRLQISIAVTVLLQIWRVQDLIPGLKIPGLPIAASLVSVLLYVMDRDPRRALRLRSQPILRYACGILVFVILSIPWSFVPRESFDFLVMEFWRTVALLFLVAGSVRGLADVERFAWLQLTGAALFCTVVAARYDVGANGRLGELVMYDSNDLALLIVSTLPVAVYLLSRSRTLFRRAFVLGATGVLMLTLAKTGSRGGFIGLLAGAGYMVIGLRAVAVGKRIGAVVALVILLIGFSSDRYWQMMNTLLHPSADYNWGGKSEVGRIEIWKRGLGYIAAYPLFGVGADAFSSAEGRLAPQATRHGFKWSTAHNSLILIGAEIGVVGLILFVAMFVSAFRTLSRIGRGPPGAVAFLAQTMTAALVVYAVSGFFLSAAFWPHLYALLGMVVGLAKVAPAGAAIRVSAGRSVGTEWGRRRAV